MKLKELCENRFRYEVGDMVNTPFGEGTITKDLGADAHDHHFAVVFGPNVTKLHNLQAKAYKLGSFQLKGIVRKGNFTSPTIQP